MGRVSRVAAGVAANGIGHTRNLVEKMLDPPETPACESCLFHHVSQYPAVIEPKPDELGREGWPLATIDVGPLRRHRDFRLLFIGRLVSFFGTMIPSVAVPFQVYQLSHSVVLVGLLGLVELATMVAFAFLGGALADARDRRNMVLGSEAALMVCSLVLAVNALLPQPFMWVIFTVAALWGALDALQRPSLDAM